MADSKISSAPEPTSKQRAVIVAAARKLVESNRITRCAMDPALGFKGRTCPVVNCYMRGSKGQCVANELEEAKASSKLMRDAVTVVEIIEAARNAPEFAAFTPISSTGDHRFDQFLREADIERAKLQFVLDHNTVWANLMLAIIRAQE
jgi:hypothetical protein